MTGTAGGTEHTAPVEGGRNHEMVGAAAFLLAAAAAVGLGVVYFEGGQPQLEGVLLGVAFAALAYGFVTWANKLLPQGPFVDQRHELASSSTEQSAFETDLERGGEIERRTLLVRTLGIAVVALGGAALFPIRSLGPAPGRALTHTPWAKGRRMVTEDGTPVNVADVPMQGLVTVFPEGSAGSATAQTVLLRVDPGLIRARRGRETWSPGGFIAYSKICTHAGCPVGLFQANLHQLLCPCHQSSFDVLRGAKPVFGPAAAPLPQLPISVDPDGYLVAQSDYHEPVGPAFWWRRS